MITDQLEPLLGMAHLLARAGSVPSDAMPRRIRAGNPEEVRKTTSAGHSERFYKSEEFDV